MGLSRREALGAAAINTIRRAYKERQRERERVSGGGRDRTKVEDGKRQTESESFGISHFAVVAKILGKRFDILPTKELIICALNGTASRAGKQTGDGVEGQQQQCRACVSRL